MISTKLQGLCLMSNWYCKISSQPSLHAPVDPGKQKTYVLFIKAATARDCIADVPIFSKLTWRNNSPNPSICLLAIAFTPEAVNAIASKHIDGFGELFRQVSFEKIGTSAIQSRAVAALINSTYVFCLPDQQVHVKMVGMKFYNTS